ncbi:MAG: hypothetical protein MR658_05820 [Campylobacter sp.]|uniref:hypothetical protein n=1 Tax=Campylobacter sp. TaxID=205 RepID=UPI002AA7D06F|nr:hypothetical protein [Campylobacter sp.]MCI6178326.1 hypothetical protein [Campylobacter sp.]
MDAFCPASLAQPSCSGEIFAPFFYSFALKNRHEISPATTVDAAPRLAQRLAGQKSPHDLGAYLF